MALDDFILKKNQIVLTKDTFSASGMLLSNTVLTYGYVEKINDLCDFYQVGDYVIFDPTNAVKFSYDSVFYYLLDEKDVWLIEPFIAP
jgi:co-chaperonin GroES (HSP10)